MKPTPKPRRDFAALETRRQQAGRLFSRHLPQAAVARQLGVSRQSVSRWHLEWSQKGVRGLRGAGRAGRKPRLSPVQLRRVAAALDQGAAAHGFSADLWTLPRVALVIQRKTGVAFHPGHVWKILGALNWSVQKPERQAKERSEEKIHYWRTVRWPTVKKTLSTAGPGSSFRTNRDSPSSPPSAPPGRRAAKRRS